MQVSSINWTKTEEEIAHQALKKAHQRETDYLIQQVREYASQIAEIDDLWRINDFLSARRHDIDGKYDYRDSMFVFVFSQLIKEGWLKWDDLEGLSQDKLTKISALTRI